MKRYTLIDLAWLLIAWGSLAAFVTGCGTMGQGGVGAALKPFVRQTNIVETVTTTPAATNLVQVPTSPAITNLVQTSAGIVTNITPPAFNPVVIVTPAAVSTNRTTNILVEVNPAWEKAIAGAQMANSTLNPTPTAPLVNIGLGILSAGLGWWGRLQTRRLAASAADKSKLQTALESVIAGVEEANHPYTKAAIERLAGYRGAGDLVNEQVQRVTK